MTAEKKVSGDIFAHFFDRGMSGWDPVTGRWSTEEEVGSLYDAFQGRGEPVYCQEGDGKALSVYGEAQFTDFIAELRLKGMTQKGEVGYLFRYMNLDRGKFYAALLDLRRGLFKIVAYPEEKTLGSIRYWVNPRTWYRLNLACEGKRIRAKVWKDGATEPEAWQVDLEDSRYGCGRLGVLSSGTRACFADMEVRAEGWLALREGRVSAERGQNPSTLCPTEEEAVRGRVVGCEISSLGKMTLGSNRLGALVLNRTTKALRLNITLQSRYSRCRYPYVTSLSIYSRTVQDTVWLQARERQQVTLKYELTVEGEGYLNISLRDEETGELLFRSSAYPFQIPSLEAKIEGLKECLKGLLNKHKTERISLSRLRQETVSGPRMAKSIRRWQRIHGTLNRLSQRMCEAWAREESRQIQGRSGKVLLPEPEEVQVVGELRVRMKMALGHLLRKREERVLRDLAADGDWGSDYPGRWVRVVAFLGSYLKDKKSATRAAHLFQQWLTYQSPSGNFGQENWAAFSGLGRGLIGILDYEELTGDPRALAAARKVGEYCCRVWPRLENPDEFYTSILEGLVKLWQRTNEGKFMDLALRVADSIMPVERQHSHMYLASLRGLVNLYESTGQRRWLERVLSSWRHIVKEEMWASGGIPEHFETNEGSDEGCSVADWLCLNLLLWRVSQDGQYLDMAERVLFNHLYFDQYRNGGFAANCNIDEGFRGPLGDICCDMHGAQAFYEVVRYLYALRPGEIWVNLFFPSQATLDMDGVKVRVQQETQYPLGDSVVLHLEPERPSKFLLRVRIPSSVRLMSVLVNGQGTTHQILKDAVLIQRLWQAGDRVEIIFKRLMRVELDTSGLSVDMGWVRIEKLNKVAAKRIVVFFGPLAIAVFRVGHGNDISWVYTGDYPEVFESGGAFYNRHTKQFYTGSTSYLIPGKKPFSAAGPPSLTEVRRFRNSVRIDWSFALPEGGRLRRQVRVFASLPVTLEQKEFIRLPSWKTSNVEGPIPLCGGLRMALRKEGPETRSFGALYSRPRVVLDRKVKYGNLVEGTYRITNGQVTARCDYRGDVGAVRVLARRYWVGAYIVPDRQKLLVARQAGRTISFSQKIIFSSQGPFGESES